ncbi:MAG TPA: sulfatase-like hydrolase/transferase [Flavitalea sp.]|nr:sulfatase-like hydrolase/transferase [Flavitalea sp.]
MIEIVTIFFLSSSASSADGKTLREFKSAPCDSCKAPSVYLVVMDEYMGAEGLKEYFHYSNSSFENFLDSREFRVFKNSKSNYQRTLFSMASILNMRYIPELSEGEMDERYAYNKVLSLLRNNVVCNIFQHNGYKTINLSPFEIRNAPSEIISTELPQRIELIAAQTMVYRIVKYMPGWLADLKIIARSKKGELTIVDANELAMKRALTIAEGQGTSPVFAYVHLMMPHPPFVFDSLGRKTGFWSQNLSPVETDKAYFQYLVYTNHRIEKFIQQLQQATMHKAVIALMSDHGYRAAAQSDIQHAYQTLNAIFLPDRNYGPWYDGMSNVNQFRMLLNSVFGQRLPLLKDSIVYQSGLD